MKNYSVSIKPLRSAVPSQQVLQPLQQMNFGVWMDRLMNEKVFPLLIKQYQLVSSIDEDNIYETTEDALFMRDLFVVKYL
jgi:hypothetical protein